MDFRLKSMHCTLTMGEAKQSTLYAEYVSEAQQYN